MCESGFRTISMKIKSPQGGFFYVRNQPVTFIPSCNSHPPALQFCPFDLPLSFSSINV